MSLPIPPSVRRVLQEQFSVPVTLQDEFAKEEVAKLIKAGKINAGEYETLLKSEQAKWKAKTKKMIKSLLSEADDTEEMSLDEQEIALMKKHGMTDKLLSLGVPPGDEPSAEEQERALMIRMGREHELPLKKDFNMNTGTSEDIWRMAAKDAGHELPTDSPHIRVKNSSEQYSTQRAVLKHAKSGEAVYPIRNGSKSTTPVESLSQWEEAKIGAWLKWKAAKAGFASLNEHDKNVLHESFEKDYWIGYQNDSLVRMKGVKALIDDSTSGGENLVPEYYDQRIISFPLLHSEILPFVDVVDVPRGSTVETASIGNPTLTWNTAEASAQSLFTTDALVAAISASVFPVAVYLQIGRDLMSDSLAMIGRQLTENVGQRIAAELDKVILTGNGTSQPQGIDVASGTTDVTPTTPTTGAITVDDLLSLMFGIGKQYRVPSFNPRFAMTDARYKSHRAIATGVTGDDRLLHGMNVQSYSLLESPVGIENDGLDNSDGIFGAFSKYRLWRRAGFETGFESGGDTLVRSNSVLFWGRGRYAGKVVDANAFAVIDAWPATA